MIWELVCCQPRIINIWDMVLSDVVRPGTNGFYTDPKEEPFAWESESVPPAVLSVSREARRIGLKYHERDFSTGVEDYHGPFAIRAKALKESGLIGSATSYYLSHIEDLQTTRWSICLIEMLGD